LIDTKFGEDCTSLYNGLILSIIFRLADLDYWMNKLVACYLYTKISFFSLLESGNCESSLYFNIWCSSFIRWNGRLISLYGGLLFIVDVSSFDCCCVDSNFDKSKSTIYLLCKVFAWSCIPVQGAILWVVVHPYHFRNHHQDQNLYLAKSYPHMVQVVLEFSFHVSLT